MKQISRKNSSYAYRLAVDTMTYELTG